MTTHMQTILASLLASNATSSSPGVGSATSSTPATAASLSSADLSSFITLLFSFSALRDWLKLLLIGGSFETCRRLIFGLYSKFIASFWVNAYFEETDACYRWMMVWLANQPSWKKSRNVQISTVTYGAKSSAIELDGEDNFSEYYKSYRRLSYLPSLSVTYNLWYKRCYMSITRTQEQSGMQMFGHKEHTLRISLLTRNRDMLIQLLQDARENYMAAQASNMSVFVADGMSNGWKLVASRSKRSMSSIILDPGIKELLMKDARDFMSSKLWYTERGIPFRRGYLLWGVPGSGKSSLIHAIAGELGLDVFVIALAKAGMDDGALNELINNLPERCIALMEDVDAAFTHGITRDSGPPADVASNPPNMAPGHPMMPGGFPGGMAPGGSRLTLSGLLNALDGVSAQEGRILFATTNRYSALDSALCRPGRMDVHIEFRQASKYQAKQLFLRFFDPAHKSSSSEVSREDDESETSSVDSGYVSSVPNSSHDELGESSEKAAVKGAGGSVYNLKLSPKHLDRLAESFSGAIPDRQFSMAALQGYLMMYKMQPEEAVEQVGEWVVKEKAEQSLKAKLARDEKDPAKPSEETHKTEPSVTKEKEQDIMQRVEKEVRERMVREKLEKELTEKIEKDMATKMDAWFNERKQKNGEFVH